MVADMTDDEVWRLRRGGHDLIKVYAAYAAAVSHQGQPTVILAKTVKGYGMGEAGEGMNITHQQKKMDVAALKQFRDRFNIPIPDEEIAEVPFFRPAEDSIEIRISRSAARRWAASCPSAGAGQARWKSRRWPRSTPCSRAARITNFRPRWPLCASSTR